MRKIYQNVIIIQIMKQEQRFFYSAIQQQYFTDLTTAPKQCLPPAV